MRKLFWTTTRLFIIALGIYAAYTYRAPITHTTREFITNVWPPEPCTVPIKYSFGDIDPRFNLSQKELKSALDQSTGIWESAIDRNLFEYSTTSPDVTINFVYDYRQQATTQLNKLGTVIKNDHAGYASLKSRYDALHESYTVKKANVAEQLKDFNLRKKTYQEKVTYWNSNGGAPAEEYQKLQAELAALNTLTTKLNEEQAILNNMVNNINAMVPILNSLARELNITVKKYNSVGSTTGDEFSEAEYVEDETGKHIEIYQFNNRKQLVRVLEHELGHALGLTHVENPKAIMYRLNQSTSEALTAEDISQLQTVCRISTAN